MVMPERGEDRFRGKNDNSPGPRYEMQRTGFCPKKINLDLGNLDPPIRPELLVKPSRRRSHGDRRRQLRHLRRFFR